MLHDHVPHLPLRSRPEASARPASSPLHGAPSSHPADREVPRFAATDAVRRAIADVWAAQAGRGRRTATGRLGADAEMRPSPEVLRLLAQVRAAVTLYVFRLRSEGLPPERVLSCVKTVVGETASPRQSLDASNELMAQVVRWTIEAYFDEPELQGSPRFF